MSSIDNQLVKKFLWGFCLFLVEVVLLSVAEVFIIEVCFQLMFHLLGFLSKCHKNDEPERG